MGCLWLLGGGKGVDEGGEKRGEWKLEGEKKTRGEGTKGGFGKDE